MALRRRVHSMYSWVQLHQSDGERLRQVQGFFGWSPLIGATQLIRDHASRLKLMDTAGCSPLKCANDKDK